MHNPQFYVYGKRPIDDKSLLLIYDPHNIFLRNTTETFFDEFPMAIFRLSEEAGVHYKPHNDTENGPIMFPWNKPCNRKEAIDEKHDILL